MLVAPGTYFENIDFLGKAITVKSEEGPATTIIDGNLVDTVVIFLTGEGPDSVLDGFTIRNGKSGFSGTSACFGRGGGICVGSASPTITNNEIVDNFSCNGNGIAVHFGSPTIQNNRISNNVRVGCTGGTDGGGILIGGLSNVKIIGNTISGNSTGTRGGGISLFAAGNPLIQDNLIISNVANDGGGISIVNDASGARIVQNLIAENTAPRGAGISMTVPSSLGGPSIVNNTIVNNNSTSDLGSGIYTIGFEMYVLIINNIVIGAEGQTSIYCASVFSPDIPIFEFNNAFTPLGPAYGGICDETGMDGNISEDPLFVDPSNGDYRLQFGSPSIDTGDNTAPNLPANDLDGNARIFDGDGDAVAVVDMGAYEFGSHPIDLDVEKFLTSRRVSLSGARPVRITVVITNVSMVPGEGTATVMGEQNGTVIYDELLPFRNDAIGEGRPTTLTFPPYTPVMGGDILWTVTIDDGDGVLDPGDQATASTRVSGGSGDPE